MTAPLTVDITIAAAEWQRLLPDAETVARLAAEAAWRSLKPSSRAAELSILLADDATVRRLNMRHRSLDRPTNVLSFPLGMTAAPAGDLPMMLGDVVLAGGVVAREAETQGKAVGAHLSHLVVHGVLHLLGYDHETDPEAEAMEALEVKTLAGLGIPNPYGYREAAE